MKVSAWPQLACVPGNRISSACFTDWDYGSEEQSTTQLSGIVAEQMSNRMFRWKRRVLVHMVEAIRMSCDLVHGPHSEWQGSMQHSVGVERASSKLDSVGDITIYKINIE